MSGRVAILSLVLPLACLARTGHAYEAQASSRLPGDASTKSEESGKLRPLESLEMLLLALQPASSFKLPGVRTGGVRDSMMITRRSAAGALLGVLAMRPMQAFAASETEPDALLRFASSLTSILRPVYKVEAPLQAGTYDRDAVRAQIEKEAAGSPVLVYSYRLSPFCSEAKRLLTAAGAKYKVAELGDEWIPGLMGSESAAIRAELGEMTGQTSMPHIWIGGESIGGLFSGTPGLVPLLETGALRGKLESAKAL